MLYFVECTFIIHTRDLVDGAHFMIGDINLFLSSTYEDDDEECVRPGTLTGEINVMIAEAAYRGKGLATEAILLMMHYGAHALGIKKFMCKIHESNAASIHMFKRYCTSNIFRVIY
jgi:RimJ/RimL family protein N-acetyltransferase